MSTLLLLTSSPTPTPAAVIPSLELLPHTVVSAPAEPTALLDVGAHDLVLVDARAELPQARSLCRMLRTTGLSVPMVVIVTEGGLAGVNDDWGLDDVVLHTAGPAEVDARIRLALGRSGDAGDSGRPEMIRQGDLAIDENTYSARLSDRPLDLTFKEFELLKYLAQHPGRVFSRQQLLQEVWGYDYFGGTRTVDVHVRRLRAKLGPEHETLIGTVRNVGYHFVKPDLTDERRADALTREPTPLLGSSDSIESRSSRTVGM